MGETCGTCACFVRFDYPANRYERMGGCHAHPPLASPLDRRVVADRAPSFSPWPLVTPRSWCAEYKPKEATE